VVLLLPLSLIGVWRFKMIKARYDALKLKRMDMIINPLLTVFDLPWLLLMAATLVLTPWRFVTTFRKVSAFHSHFPNDEMSVVSYQPILFTFLTGLLDYILSPLYLIALMHPFHWRPMISNLIINAPQPDFARYDSIRSFEDQRRTIGVILAFKTIIDVFQCFILFPINMLSLFYAPLAFHLLKTQAKAPTGEVQRHMTSEGYKAA